MGADDAISALLKGYTAADVATELKELVQFAQQPSSTSSSSKFLLLPSYTTLDDVYYSLITQKGKTAPIGKYNSLNIPSIIEYSICFKPYIRCFSGCAFDITVARVALMRCL